MFIIIQDNIGIITFVWLLAIQKAVRCFLTWHWSCRVDLYLYHIILSYIMPDSNFDFLPSSFTLWPFVVLQEWYGSLPGKDAAPKWGNMSKSPFLRVEVPRRKNSQTIPAISYCTTTFGHIPMVWNRHQHSARASTSFPERSCLPTAECVCENRWHILFWNLWKDLSVFLFWAIWRIIQACKTTDRLETFSIWNPICECYIRRFGVTSAGSFCFHATSIHSNSNQISDI